MSSLQLQGHRVASSSMWLLLAMSVLMPASVPASAQLAPNQTNGFGADKSVTFTYTQNFDCVDQPNLDLDFNGVLAQSDPREMQTPICQPITEPTQDPTGGSINNTAHLYVLLPMFSVDNDRNPEHAMNVPIDEERMSCVAHGWEKHSSSSSALSRKPGRRE